MNVFGNKKCTTTTTTTTTTSVGYGLMRLSPRLLSVSILRNPLPEGTTTVQRVEREIMQHGCEDHAMGKVRSSTSSDAIRDEDVYDGYA